MIIAWLSEVDDGGWRKSGDSRAWHRKVNGRDLIFYPLIWEYAWRGEVHLGSGMHLVQRAAMGEEV